jgi:hypothetical protein
VIFVTTALLDQVEQRQLELLGGKERPGFDRLLTQRAIHLGHGFSGWWA